jgi:hypothetical protein
MGVDINFKSNLAEVMDKIDGTARARMEQAVNEIRNETLTTLSGQRSGRTYTVPGTHKTYTASAPGEAPAIATGELKQSISTEVEGEGKSVVGRVGSDKIQALMTEFGTRTIAPRPWLRVSFEKSEAKVKEIFTRLWF